jgi:hypothetical protein
MDGQADQRRVYFTSMTRPENNVTLVGRKFLIGTTGLINGSTLLDGLASTGIKIPTLST